MMRKFLILSFVTVTGSLFAQSAQEEAIILNQELQFLEDSVSNVQALSLNVLDADKKRNETLNEKSLERTYFGGDEVEEDSVNTRTAGPKRRTY